MQVTFLGTGSAGLNTERRNTSLVFSTSDEDVMIDCSGTPLRDFTRSGGRQDLFDTLLLTHTHADHVYGLPSLVHMMWLSGGIRAGKVLRVVGPEEAILTATKLVDAFGLRSKKNAVELEFVVIPSERTEFSTLKGQKLVAFPVRHGGFECLGYATTAPRRVVYTGDAVADELVAEELAQGPVELLVFDCGGGLVANPSHAGLDTIADVIAGSHISSIALTHLPQMGSGELAELTTRASAALDCAVLIPADGETLDL